MTLSVEADADDAFWDGGSWTSLAKHATMAPNDSYVLCSMVADGPLLRTWTMHLMQSLPKQLSMRCDGCFWCSDQLSRSNDSVSMVLAMTDGERSFSMSLLPTFRAMPSLMDADGQPNNVVHMAVLTMGNMLEGFLKSMLAMSDIMSSPICTLRPCTFEKFERK